MEAKLVLVDTDITPNEFKLRLPATVGRSRQCTLKLVHPQVSRQHCEIFEVDGMLMVRDLGSANGTFIANERISEAQLAPGQLLTLGTVTFRAVYGDDVALAPPEAPSVGDTKRYSPAMEETQRVPIQGARQDKEQDTAAFDASWLDDAESDQNETVDAPPAAAKAPPSDDDDAMDFLNMDDDATEHGISHDDLIDAPTTSIPAQPKKGAAPEPKKAPASKQAPPAPKKAPPAKKEPVQPASKSGGKEDEELENLDDFFSSLE